ncbi:hypothetical protein TrVE_jg6214 [Triparma verrucosa]|uniref:chitin synthase n=1 Tax=Triparma verrucosa TaxID=1606542 RepID=A0A9W7EQW4_9STRA|nr:hypothetical protein TrVE_jg6214 [Triparma verrucosa]
MDAPVLPFINPQDAPPLPFIRTYTVASRIQGKSPSDKSLASILKPLPKDENFVAALVPAYNEEASDALTTLIDLWCQQQLLGGNKKILAVLVLDGVDRGPDNPRKIISKSMEDFLINIFPNSRPSWQEFESDFDESSNLILQNQDSNSGELAPVEFAEGMALQLIVLVKRTNRLKFNSHEWFLKGIAYHYRKQIPYVFLTDAGTGFDRHCLRHLIDHLSRSSEDVVACTGRQRKKTAAMQSHGMICAEPLFGRAWWLRSLQAYEYEAGVSTFNGVFSLLGYMPVLPGPCALLKYHTCLADGGIDEYLDLVTSPPSEFASDKELWQRGNENLAEDRILSFTIVFPSQLKAVRRTEWVPLALFYDDAELHLESLCPQRRRWINGTYAAFLTVASKLDELVNRGAAPNPHYKSRRSNSWDSATDYEVLRTGYGNAKEWVSSNVNLMSDDQFGESLFNCCNREKTRWGNGLAVLRLRALHVLVLLQIAMHAITSISPSLFGLALRLSFLTLIQHSSGSNSLWEEDRASRARIVCLFTDVAIWLGLRAWLNIHSTSKPGRVDTRMMIFYILVVLFCWAILILGMVEYTAKPAIAHLNASTDCDFLPIFPLFLAVIQFGGPFMLATAYSFLAAVGNATSVRSLAAGMWLGICHVFGSVVPYIISLPCYVILMHLYSTSRLHDLSWGTRDTSAGEDLAARQGAVESVSADFSRDVLLYNGFVLGFGFTLDLLFGETSTAIILSIVAIFVVLPGLIHVVGSTIHLIFHLATVSRLLLRSFVVLLIITICLSLGIYWRFFGNPF